MLAPKSPVPLAETVQALVVERRCSFTAALVVQALLHERSPLPMTIFEVLCTLERCRVPEEEARAALAEAMLLDLVHTDGSEGDNSFLWSNVNKYRYI